MCKPLCGYCDEEVDITERKFEVFDQHYFCDVGCFVAWLQKGDYDE